MATDWTKTTRDPSVLDPHMRVRLRELVRMLEAEGVEVLQLDTYRDPWTQARLFRRSRLRQEIQARVERLERMGWPQLGAILEEVGPQPGTVGEHVTWVGPGESWHQYGMAADLVPRFDSKRLLWDVPLGAATQESRQAAAMWETVAACAEAADLTWGGAWQSPDRMHVQLPAADGGSPLIAMSRESLISKATAKEWWV